MREVLLITGDFSEDYEIIVPRQALNMLGFRADVVCPGKRTGEFIKTAIHDFEGDQTYTEKPEHLFRLTVSFDGIRLQKYSGIYISGGCSSECLQLDKSVLDIMYYAMNLILPVVTICRGPQALAAAGALRGWKLTGYFMIKPEAETADGQWVTVAGDETIVDGGLIATTIWMGYPVISCHFIT